MDPQPWIHILKEQKLIIHSLKDCLKMIDFLQNFHFWFVHCKHHTPNHLKKGDALKALKGYFSFHENLTHVLGLES